VVEYLMEVRSEAYQVEESIDVERVDLVPIEEVEDLDLVVFVGP
jgi:hypothetical protein